MQIVPALRAIIRTALGEVLLFRFSVLPVSGKSKLRLERDSAGLTVRFCSRGGGGAPFVEPIQLER